MMTEASQDVGEKAAAEAPAGSLHNEEETSNSVVSAIRLVVQRYRKASMLIDENRVVTVGEASSSLLPEEDPPTSVGLLDT
jgi:hypothetical protein